jgi:hypothetical protein
MREKYVEERFPRYFIWGETRDGRVDVSDVTGTYHAVHVPRKFAEHIIDERDNAVDMLVELALALDNADHDIFTKIWYGK